MFIILRETNTSTLILMLCIIHLYWLVKTRIIYKTMHAPNWFFNEREFWLKSYRNRKEIICCMQYQCNYNLPAPLCSQSLKEKCKHQIWSQFFLDTRKFFSFFSNYLERFVANQIFAFLYYSQPLYYFVVDVILYVFKWSNILS